MATSSAKGEWKYVLCLFLFSSRFQWLRGSPAIHEGEHGRLPKNCEITPCGCISVTITVEKRAAVPPMASSPGNDERKYFNLPQSARWAEAVRVPLPLRRGWGRTWPSSGCPPRSPPPPSSAPPPEARGRCLPGSPTGPSEHRHITVSLHGDPL